MLLSKGNKQHKNLSYSCYQTHCFFLPIFLLGGAETCSLRDAGAQFGSETGLQFKGAARTDGDPEVIF